MVMKCLFALQRMIAAIVSEPDTVKLVKKGNTASLQERVRVPEKNIVRIDFSSLPREVFSDNNYSSIEKRGADQLLIGLSDATRSVRPDIVILIDAAGQKTYIPMMVLITRSL